MKKALKEHLNVWAISLLVLFATLLTSCSNGILTKIEENPASVATVIGVELPELELVKSDRGVGSHYLSYTYEFKFLEPMSKEHITNLEELCKTDKHWSKNYCGDYIYETNINGDIMDCLISEEYMVFGYSESDGEEEIADFFIISLAIIRLIAIFVGIIAFIVFLIRRSKK